jgi:hypothetical protein
VGLQYVTSKSVGIHIGLKVEEVTGILLVNRETEKRLEEEVEEEEGLVVK